MGQQITQILAQIKQRWSSLQPAQRRALTYGGIAAFFSLALLTAVSMYEPYGVLFDDLDRAQASRMVEQLKKRGVPYRLADDSRSVEVPEAQIPELRVTLAQEGLTGGLPSGFELIDRAPFGENARAQQLRLQRALEGELARTLTAVQGVHAARVHLAIPERSIFTEQSSAPRASVTLTLDGGRHLDKSEIEGIRNIVASAVPKLQTQAVSVVDSSGRLLSRSDESGDDALVERQHRIEQETEQRVVSLIERVVGRGRASARVVVELEPDQVVETSKLYDPERSVVRSEERSEEEKTVGASPGGVAGAAANAKGMLQVAASGSGGSSNREVTNYELSYTSRRVDRLRGGIRRISAAILVGRKRVEQPPGSGTFVDVELSDEELKRIDTLVKSAVGYDARRGDRVQVESMELVEIAPEVSTTVQLLPWLAPAFKILGVTVLAVLLLLLVVRPAMRSLSGARSRIDDEPRDQDGQPLALPIGDEGGDADDSIAGHLPAPDENMQELRERALEAALDRSDRAAEIVRAWLEEDARQNEEAAEAEAEAEAQHEAEEHAA